MKIIGHYEKRRNNKTNMFCEQLVRAICNDNFLRNLSGATDEKKKII